MVKYHPKITKDRNRMDSVSEHEAVDGPVWFGGTCSCYVQIFFPIRVYL